MCRQSTGRSPNRRNGTRGRRGLPTASTYPAFEGAPVRDTRRRSWIQANARPVLAPAGCDGRPEWACAHRRAIRAQGQRAVRSLGGGVSQFRRTLTPVGGRSRSRRGGARKSGGRLHRGDDEPGRVHCLSSRRWPLTGRNLAMTKRQRRPAGDLRRGRSSLRGAETADPTDRTRAGAVCGTSAPPE
jgi:hypothetical protein